MSSDLYDVRIAAVNGSKITFEVLTGTAGGPKDFASTRSFALNLIAEALPRSGAHATPAVRKRLAKKQAAAALTSALGGGNLECLVSEQWMHDHVAEYIVSSTLTKRRNNVAEKTLAQREKAIAASFEGVAPSAKTRTAITAERWQKCHNFTLEVVVTDPRWLAHLEAGVEFGTTAYDVWDDHRKPAGRPSSEVVDAALASAEPGQVVYIGGFAYMKPSPKIVFLGDVRDLAALVSAAAIKAHGDRAIWLHSLGHTSTIWDVPETSPVTPLINEALDALVALRSSQSKSRPQGEARPFVELSADLAVGLHVDLTADGAAAVFRACGFEVRPLASALEVARPRL